MNEASNIPSHFFHLPAAPQPKHLCHGPTFAVFASSKMSTSSKHPPRTSMHSCHTSQNVRDEPSLPEGTQSVFTYPPKRYILPVTGSVKSCDWARYVGKPRVRTCFHFHVNSGKRGCCSFHWRRYFAWILVCFYRVNR